jgi:hypothetical protein
MQSLSPRDRDNVSRRRARVECTLCGRYIDLAQLRVHLRELHHLESARLDQILAEARRTALRGRTRQLAYTPG